MIEYVLEEVYLKLPSAEDKWMEELLWAYLLPPATSHQSRDEFLNALLKTSTVWNTLCRFH